MEIESSTRYYISDLKETALQFYQRIRGYWGVENKVHYVRDVTQGEDKSRIRITPLPQILAVARNLAINLYPQVLVTEEKRQDRFNVVVYWKRKYNNKQLPSPWYLLTNLENKDEVIKHFLLAVN